MIGDHLPGRLKAIRKEWQPFDRPIQIYDRGAVDLGWGRTI